MVCAISREEVAERVAEIAKQISADYTNQLSRPSDKSSDCPMILVVGVLKGAWVFMADLVRHLQLDVRCDFVRLSSYGSGTVSAGQPRLMLDVSEAIQGQHVLIVDDIIDTGISLQWLSEHLSQRQPASLKSCVLLDKPARREVDIQADYVGFQIPDRFVVGYGIDFAQQYRALPYIGYVDPSSQESP